MFMFSYSFIYHLSPWGFPSGLHQATTGYIDNVMILSQHRQEIGVMAVSNTCVTAAGRNGSVSGEFPSLSWRNNIFKETRQSICVFSWDNTSRIESGSQKRQNTELSIHYKFSRDVWLDRFAGAESALSSLFCWPWSHHPIAQLQPYGRMEYVISYVNYTIYMWICPGKCLTCKAIMLMSNPGGI